MSQDFGGDSDEAIRAIQAVVECEKKGEPVPLWPWLVLNTYLLNLTKRCHESGSKQTEGGWPNPTEADPTEADPTEADPTEADPTEADPTEADPTEVDPTEAEMIPIEAVPVEVEMIPVEVDQIFYNSNKGNPDRFSNKGKCTTAIIYGAGSRFICVSDKVFNTWKENKWLEKNKWPEKNTTSGKFVQFRNIEETEGAVPIKEINGVVKLLFEGTPVVKDTETGLVFYTDFKLEPGTCIKNGCLRWSTDYDRYYVSI